jgi:hypothetical protein
VHTGSKNLQRGPKSPSRDQNSSRPLLRGALNLTYHVKKTFFNRVSDCMYMCSCHEVKSLFIYLRSQNSAVPHKEGGGISPHGTVQLKLVTERRSFWAEGKLFICQQEALENHLWLCLQIFSHS